MKHNMEPTTPLLPRIDRLDRLLELLEEKHSQSRRFNQSNNYLDNDDADEGEKKDDHMNCKTLSSALEDVHQKGTLIDRLAMLENRVLQLSVDMEDGSTSKSSSSTTAYATKEEKELPIGNCSIISNGKGNRKKVPFKWMGWFAMRC